MIREQLFTGPHPSVKLIGKGDNACHPVYWQFPKGSWALIITFPCKSVTVGNKVKSRKCRNITLTNSICYAISSHPVPVRRSLSLRMSHQLHSSSSGGRAARPSSLFLIATEPLTLWKCVPTEIMTNGLPSLSAFVQLYYLPQLGTSTRPPSLAKLY